MNKLSPLVGQALRPPRPGNCPSGLSGTSASSRQGRKHPGILLVVVLSGLLCGCGRVTKAVAPPPSAEEKGRQQKILFYVKVMRDSLKAIKSDEDEDPKKKISYQSPTESLWNELVDLQAAGGDFAGATDTADAHRRTDDKGFAYLFIATAQAEAGDVAGAEASAKHYRVTEPILKYALPAAVALAKARAGDWKPVKAMLVPPPPPGDEDGPAGGLFDALVNGVLAARPREIALLDQVLALAPTPEGQPWFDLQALQTLQAIGLARAGKFDPARAVLAKITFPRLRIWVLRNLALQQVRAGDRQGARGTLAPARALLDADYALNKLNPGEKFPEGTSLRMNLYDYCSQLGNLADTQMLIGDAAGAKKTLETLKENKEQDQYSPALPELAACQAEAGDFPGAEETARSNADINERARGLGLVAQAQVAQGHPEAARRDVEEAERLLRENREKRGDFSNSNPNARPVSLALAQLDGADAGVRFAREMQPDDPGVRMLNSTRDIAAMVAQRQEPADAQKWVERQTDDPHVRAMYYQAMGEAAAEPPSTPHGMDSAN